MIEDWLKNLGINGICEFDMLVFLHRHRTALLSAEHISRLMCYGTRSVIGALDHLESLGIVKRSRLSQGARFYQLNQLQGPRRRAFEELLGLAETRAGRLKIAESLREVDSRTVIFLHMRAGKLERKASRQAEQSSLTSRKEGDKWPKAI